MTDESFDNNQKGFLMLDKSVYELDEGNYCCEWHKI